MYVRLQVHYKVITIRRSDLCLVYCLPATRVVKVSSMKGESVYPIWPLYCLNLKLFLFRYCMIPTVSSLRKKCRPNCLNCPRLVTKKLDIRTLGAFTSVLEVLEVKINKTVIIDLSCRLFGCV